MCVFTDTAITESKVIGQAGKVADAGIVFKRSLEDISSLHGAKPEEIENIIPDGWVSGPMKKGEGVRYLNPKKPGEAIIIGKGWPGAADPLHSGPYVRISRDGVVERIPLEGNPVLGE